jgi:hypothetical protein
MKKSSANEQECWIRTRENFSRKANAPPAVRAPARFQVQSLVISVERREIMNKMKTIAVEASSEIVQAASAIGTTFGDSA